VATNLKEKESELAYILSVEVGKTLKEATIEVGR
jgi:hypothetical protein